MTANVALTDTFDQWRVKTNELLVGTQSDGMANIIKTTDTTNSTSNTTGSIITAGGIGVAKSAHIGGDLKVWGDVTTVGDTTISGNLTFGDGSTDQVTFDADINSNLIPNANLTFNVGNTLNQWANTYTGHLAVTQKSDSGKSAVTITSTAVDQIGISVVASQTTADVFDIAADAVTTARVIDITADGLTTGSGIYLDDNSASTGTRKTVEIIQNNAAAIAATALQVQSDGGITGITLDKNFSDVAAATVTGLHIDFDRTVPGSGTATFTDIGIDLDVNAAGLGTTTTTGLDIDVVGATTGTHTAIGLDVAVGSADTNIAARFTGGEVAMLTTTKLSFHDVGGGENILASADGHLEVNAGTTLDITAPTVDINVATTLNVDGPTQITGAVIVGVNDTGHDVKFFGATAGKSLLWDESADSLIVTGTTTLVGTTNLDAVDIDGVTQIDATVTVGVNDTGYDVKLFGATAGSFMLWNQATDSLHLTDSSPIKVGDAQDMTLYHDGTNSYITNAVGILKVATEASGIAVSIGHTTSETTINDNLIVTGDLTINGTTSTINSTTLTVDDKNIEMGSVDTPSDTTADGGGFTLKGTTDKTITWTNATDAWIYNQGIIVGVDNTGHDVKFFGATSGSFMLWNQATDSLHLTDSSPIKVGDAQDMTLYHDGTNSYITNSTGALKVATESSGIAVTIGHTTSVVTIGDNLTVTDTITESSMREMKDNIQPIENILPAVMQMQGVTFDWKKDKDNDKRSNHYGFIAEDVNEVLPGLVSYSPDGKPMGIQYSKMTAVLLEAIKEQQVQIDELKSLLN